MAQFFKNIEIENIWYKWVWIATLPNGKKLLISGSVIPHATVTCCIIKKRKDFIQAKLIAITAYKWQKIDETIFETFPELQKPACAHYNNPLVHEQPEQEPTTWCGWCKRQILSEWHQGAIKMWLFENIRENAPYIHNVHMHDMLLAPDAYYYRNKIEFSFGKYISGWEHPQNNHRQMGFHKQWFFSKVVDVERCHLIDDDMHTVFETIKQLCKESWLPVHDQKTHEWFFRHLVIRHGKNTWHMLINLVIADKQLTTPIAQTLRKELQDIFLSHKDLKKLVTSFCITTNNWLADIVRWQDTTTRNLRWDWYMYEHLEFWDSAHTNMSLEQQDNTHVSYIMEDWQAKAQQTTQQKQQSVKDSWPKVAKFRISPFSFFQTNTRAAEMLFAQAASILWKSWWVMFDIYCGTGSIWISMLKLNKADQIIGIEIVPEAIIDAQYNAKINAVQDQTYFVAGKAEELVHSDPRIQQALTTVQTIVVDPPRDGLHKNVIKFLNTLKQQHQCKLLYISCNPVTMRRDADLLIEWGRKLTTLQPIDMFPQTHHLETIWLFL